MAVLFAVRGSAYNARYSTGYNYGTPFNSGQISISAGDITSIIDLSNTAVVKYVSWSGVKNMPNARTHSVLVRFAPTYTGAPAATRAILEINSGASASGAFIIISHATATGNLTVTARNQAGASAYSTSFGAWSPTSGTYYDLVWQWDGTTTANAGKVYIDNSLLGQATASVALDTNWDNTYWKSIAVGAASGLTTSALKLSELVVFDSLISAGNVTLTSGSGTLSGASRTAFVDAAAFDGSSNTDPGIANVRLSTGYTIAGAALTGTAAIPTAANVRSGTATDATTGSLAVPAASSVRSGTATDNTTGTLDLPATTDVKTGVTFDGASKTGTYTGSDRWSDPGVTHVEAGISYKANSTTNNKTGTLVGGKGNLGPGRIG